MSPARRTHGRISLRRITRRISAASTSSLAHPALARPHPIPYPRTPRLYSTLPYPPSPRPSSGTRRTRRRRRSSPPAISSNTISFPAALSRAPRAAPGGGLCAPAASTAAGGDGGRRRRRDGRRGVHQQWRFERRAHPAGGRVLGALGRRRRSGRAPFQLAQHRERVGARFDDGVGVRASCRGRRSARGAAGGERGQSSASYVKTSGSRRRSRRPWANMHLAPYVHIVTMPPSGRSSCVLQRVLYRPLVATSRPAAPRARSTARWPPRATWSAGVGELAAARAPPSAEQAAIAVGSARSPSGAPGSSRQAGGGEQSGAPDAAVRHVHPHWRRRRRHRRHRRVAHRDIGAYATPS